jgi:predicted ATPase/DNA-binding CsgD family transcriptional regulator
LARATNPAALPIPAGGRTSFVGRRAELAQVKELLSSSRLVTLVGPAGVGKTRLAIRSAHEVRRAFPGGVSLAELADLRDPALLAETVASALGVRDTSTRWLVGTLADYLSAKRLLLVLDNCEHLIDACAVLADGLLRGCPDLRIICTSREPLSVEGETVLDVAPLPVPADRDVPPTALEGYDAVRLFTERAAAAWPAFAITASNAADVATLCQRLDGLPLALELAAVRLRAFTVGQIVEQLDRRFGLLSAGPRTASARHQNLRAAIDWSHELLSHDEQVAWRRLSIFAGSFDLEGATAICTGEDLPEEAIPGLVAGLVERSLLRRELHEDVPRYRMLETIREYGQERVRIAEEREPVEARHQDLYEDLAAQVFSNSWGADQAAWWERAHLELPNLRAALQRSIDRGEPERGLAIAAKLLYYWLTRGNMGEGRRWLDALLELERDPTPTRAMSLGVDGWLSQLQGDLDGSFELFAEAGAIIEGSGDAEAHCLVLVALGGARVARGEFDEAETLLRRCLDLQATLPDRRWAVNAEATLASIASGRGDHERARDLFAGAAELCRSEGDRFFRSYMLHGEGIECFILGDHEAAARIFAENLRLSRSVDHRVGVALAADAIGWLASAAGEAERAAVVAGAVQTYRRSIPVAPYPHLAPFRDASAKAARDELGDARYDAAFARGTRLAADDLIAIALGAQLAERSGERPVDPRSSGPLTKREREIAELVAEGLSNKQIAATLVISQRTAETHVEHILTKLGFTSRVQIAAWIVERGSRSDEPART